MTTQPQDDFFAGQGEKVASYKFQGIGDVVVGTVLDQFVTQQTDFATKEKLYFDNGEPRMQMNVTLQTDLRNWEKVTRPLTDDKDQPLPGSADDGKRRIYIKSDMQRAVGEAIKAAGAPGLRNGGKLAVKKSGEKDTGKGNPLPLYEARYQAPAEGDDLWGTGDSQPAQTQSAPASDDPWAKPASSTDEPPF